ncbi:MAG: complex I subunit 1 family protein [Eubacterium sp.]|nr:complex I subunit 1 family protein [Eubacterium sp.]
MIQTDSILTKVIFVAAYILLAPLIGGLLAGIDRKISARMQRRIGPPILQPFYDVHKLWHKQVIAVEKAQSWFLMTYLILMIFTGAMMFSGTDILMCFFVLSTAAAFLFFAAMVTNSPYGYIGAQRELLQIMAYEPSILMTCVGFYLVAHSFEVSKIVAGPVSRILYLPGFFAAFVFSLTIKLRKSPFDTSASRHPHQELVKGLTTEMGARNLAIFEIAEWYETVFLCGVVAMFILNTSWVSIPVAILVILAVFFLEILIDNTNARVKWQSMLLISWVVTLVGGGVNLLILMLVR